MKEKPQSENLFTPNCIRTFSGKYVNIFEPKPEMFCIEDVAHALSMQPRFAGHLPKFYSVAEHCLNGVGLYNVSNKPDAFDFLMHDCSEAYLLDIPKPIKPHLTNYMGIEDNLMRVLSGVFGFQYPLSDYVKESDLKMLHIEWDELMLQGHRTLPRSVSPNQAKKQFISMFDFLKP